jgi:xylan 1,4-beta-xylosidase
MVGPVTGSGRPAQTPVIPGFYPDPSICRAGDTYYTAHSSFEYAPGVPIFRSDDLVTWSQVGNALTRPTQLTPSTGSASSGVYAPTIRYGQGRFWLVTTDIGEFARGHLIVSAEDPAGPWSDATFVTGTLGIDPDLMWDEDGVCRLTWKSFDPARPGILSAPVDPESGRLLGEPEPLWQGLGMQAPEGPHLYRIDGWWYLLLAEGGTHTGHCVTVARGRSPQGPFAFAPTGPLLTHRGLPDPVQATGHADLVEKADGTWAMVHLGIRQRGSHPRWHVNGRETFLVGIEWVDDWPVVVEDAYEPVAVDTAFEDTFPGPLDARWISPGRHPGEFAVPGPDGLALGPGRDADARASVALLAARVTDDAWRVEVTAPEGDVALELRLDDDHWIAVQRRGDRVAVRMVIGPLDQELGVSEPVPVDAALVLLARPSLQRSLTDGPDRIAAGVVVDGELHELADVDGRYLSTEVAGGFTGRVVGVQALDGPARVSRFSYAPEVTAEE